MIHKDMGNIAQDNAKNKIMIAKKNIFHKQIVGLYVPAHEIIERTKYNWYSRLSLEQVLEAKLLISKFLLICNDNNLVFYS